MQTVVRNKLPLRLIIINNQCHGMVRQFQESYFDGRYQSLRPTPTRSWPSVTMAPVTGEAASGSAPRGRLLSFIIPACNEKANLPRLFERVGAVADGLRGRCRCEMIVLDNCSRDRTGELATAQCGRDPRWKYVRYSRNFGAEGSLLAGLDFAEGDAVINVFSDLQDPPELISQMLDEWKKARTWSMR